MRSGKTQKIPFMTIFEPGQVVLIPFPFTDLTTIKQRPALVISGTSFNQKHQDVIVLALTSQSPSDLKPDEIALTEADQKSAFLPKPSKVKTSKIVSIDKRLVRKLLGSISRASLDSAIVRVHTNLHQPLIK